MSHDFEKFDAFLFCVLRDRNGNQSGIGAALVKRSKSLSARSRLKNRAYVKYEKLAEH